jgi:hypothetical protein
VAKPEILPRWAEETQIDPITGALNKVEPTEEFKLSGLLRREFLSRSFLNYQLWLINEWIDYLSSSAVVGELENNISLENGRYQEISLTENTTLTEELESGEEIFLVVVSNGFSITWPEGTEWGGAGVPALGAKCIINIYKINLSTYAQLEWRNT